MRKKHDGFSAFPLPLGDEQINEHSAGMSLRDYFAAKAMGGMVANIVKGHVSYGNTRDMAARCYEIADEMLAERDK